MSGGVGDPVVIKSEVKPEVKPEFSRGEEDNGGSEVKEEPRPDSPDSTCAICLERLNNKSFTDRCLHTFCFSCLLEWSKIKQECPLCKKRFGTIIHNVRSEEDYDEYPVQGLSPVEPTVLINLAFQRPPFRYRTTMSGRALVHIDYLRWGNGTGSGDGSSNRGAIGQGPTRTALHDWRRRRQLGTSEFRRNIYRQGLWVRRSGDVRVRQSSPEFYRLNPAQTHRLVPWLNRELNVLLDVSLDSHSVCQEILNLITIYPIDSGHFHRAMSEYLGMRTAHFIHEFYNFATSPYDMLAYDLHAQYSSVDLHNDELLASNNGEFPFPPPLSSQQVPPPSTSSQVPPPLSFGNFFPSSSSSTSSLLADTQAPLNYSTTSESDSDIEVVAWRPQPQFGLDLSVAGPSLANGQAEDDETERVFIEISDDNDSVEFVEEFQRPHVSPEVITIDSDLEENETVETSTEAPQNDNSEMVIINDSQQVGINEGGGTGMDDINGGGNSDGIGGRKRRKAAINALVKYEFTSSEEDELEIKGGASKSMGGGWSSSTSSCSKKRKHKKRKTSATTSTSAGASSSRKKKSQSCGSSTTRRRVSGRIRWPSKWKSSSDLSTSSCSSSTIPWLSPEYPEDSDWELPSNSQRKRRTLSLESCPPSLTPENIDETTRPSRRLKSVVKVVQAATSFSPSILKEGNKLRRDSQKSHPFPDTQLDEETNDSFFSDWSYS